jgi:metallo-beta-lactamase family protein
MPLFERRYSMSVSIQFLGAAGTVTGSKYLVSSPKCRLLVDCGMFQGERSWREKNWNPPPVDLSSVDAVLLTHAHLDHVGMLPRYFKLGLRAPVYCSKATADLTRLILLDSARLQEEEALFRAEKGRSRHHPPLPLYTEADAQGALELLRPIDINTTIVPHQGVHATWRLMGHILGACSISLTIEDRRIVFSGDVGRYQVPILVDPQPVELGDLLLIESTYGDRLHAPESPDIALGQIINRTIARKGMVIIPSFALGRTQTLLYYLRALKTRNEIPDVPVIIDSPMASDATVIYQHHSNEYDEASLGILRQGAQPFGVSKLFFPRDTHDSKKLNSIFEPLILISASGMLSGGRILHHLKNRISNERNTVLFVGFQPPGSRGDWIKRGGGTVKLLGEEVTVRAEIAEISGLSAHGDRDELLRWCRSCSGKPNKVAVVHGEPGSAQKFRTSLEEQLGWSVGVPAYLDTWEI